MLDGASDGGAVGLSTANGRAAIPLVAAASFVAGFGAAELTGVRAIGGVVLIAGAAWCARMTYRWSGLRATLALVVIAMVLFVASHLLGHAIGAWPAVFVSACLLAAAAVVVLRPSAVSRAQAGSSP